MAELIPIPFDQLLKRIYYEYKRSGAIFDLPSRLFYRPSTSVDMSILFCGNPAANPLGPAAGPQTQLAQNIVLSWLGGARVIELKTIQIKDRLELSRPCIDMATVGYNTEWSQELRLQDSLREYVKGSMIVEILKHWLLNSESESEILSPKLDTIFDISVGYDLAGIQSQEIRDWLTTIRHASANVENCRAQIPSEFKSYRNLPFKTEIGNSITLSTFHGTPANEIERICEFLLTEMDFHVIIKMNPPMLGKERLEYLLHEKLGYTDIEVNEKVYDINVTFADAVDVVRRLQSVAQRQGRTIGVKFGNTLEVFNKGEFLRENIQYLSGRPLHILHLALVDEWRRTFGSDFPISFAGGVDANNFADCVSIDLVPITTCTDLLRPGGYGRQLLYLTNLERKMKEVESATIDEFIIRTTEVRDRSEVMDPNSEDLKPQRNDGQDRSISKLDSAILLNTARVLERSIENPRYHASNNRKTPRKIGSHLHLWDCINCDKCIPTCPNDANFYFEIEAVEIHYDNIIVNGQAYREIEGGVFKIEKKHQIATFADACNDCGNCDVFCPEDGGPFLMKPRFFGSLETWRRSKSLDGFVLDSDGIMPKLYQRKDDHVYELMHDQDVGEYVFHDGSVTLHINDQTRDVTRVDSSAGLKEHLIDMKHFLIMETLLKGMLNPSRVHFVNVGTNERAFEKI
jgi:putative selenate reductase